MCIFIDFLELLFNYIDVFCLFYWCIFIFYKCSLGDQFSIKTVFHYHITVIYYCFFGFYRGTLLFSQKTVFRLRNRFEVVVCFFSFAFVGIFFRLFSSRHHKDSGCYNYFFYVLFPWRIILLQDFLLSEADKINNSKGFKSLKTVFRLRFLAAWRFLDYKKRSGIRFLDYIKKFATV